MQYRYYWQNHAFNQDYEAWMREVRSPADLTWEMLSADRVIWGSPEDCAGQIEHWCKSVGSSHIQVTIPSRGPMNQEAQIAAIRLTGSRVIAKLRAN